MKRFGLCLGAVIVASSLVACSGDDGKVELDAATTPLTAEGNDKLFTLRVVDAREGGYPLDGIAVKVILDGGDPIVVTCATQDVNASSTLDKNDTIDCTEAVSNQFGVDLGGKEIDVELHAKVEGEETKVGSATWTPSK